MIQVYYWPREQRLVMEGHAAQKGLHSPVVCGSASTLFLALCTTTNGFLKYKFLKGRYYKDQKGIGYCKMWPKRRYFKRTRVAIGMCVAGLLMLADKYPDLVDVRVATGLPFDDAKVDALLDTIAGREHGLAFYLFTSDIEWAKRVMATQQYGDGCINEVCLHMMVKGTPFGGVGHSGMGNYHGEWGFREFTHPSTVLIGKTKGNLSLREHPYTGKGAGIKRKLLRLFER